MEFEEKQKLFAEGYSAGYAEAIRHADDELKKRGDSFATRLCRQAILALVKIGFDPHEVQPTPDWRRYKSLTPYDHRVR